MLRVPVTFTNIVEWVRRAATAINALIERAETPQVGDVRYSGGVLQHWDGAAWVNV